jgi:hypothetical protein
MSKQTATRQKTAARRMRVARTRRGRRVHGGKPAAKMTPPRAIGAVQPKPPAIDLFELELLLNDKDEALAAQDVLVAEFEDEDL